jgi:hypothetical protein
MTRRGVPDGDMPDSSSPAQWGIPPLGDGDLETLLARDPGDVTAPLRPVAEVLSALRAAPAPAELSGEQLAMARFREAADRAGQRRRPVASHRARSRRRGLPGLVLAPWVAAAAFLVVLAVGGVAAYTGRLPTPIQRLAHVVIAAPPAHHVTRHRPSPHPTASRSAHQASDPAARPAVPAAPGHEFSGVCHAYEHSGLPGHASQYTDAFRRLIEAAGGIGRVPAYCSAVTRQDASPGQRGPGQDNGNGNGGGHWPPGQSGDAGGSGGGQTANGQNSAGQGANGPSPAVQGVNGPAPVGPGAKGQNPAAEGSGH